LPLARYELRKEIAESYAEYLPDISSDHWRRIRGEQEIIVSFEPDEAIATLPKLLSHSEDRERFLQLLDKLASDERVLNTAPDAAQKEAFERIRAVLGPRVSRKRNARLPDATRT
jgi:hypothetical protein